jgi:hypothetical protein
MLFDPTLQVFEKIFFLFSFIVSSNTWHKKFISEKSLANEVENKTIDSIGYTKTRKRKISNREHPSSKS